MLWATELGMQSTEEGSYFPNKPEASLPDLADYEISAKDFNC